MAYPLSVLISLLAAVVVGDLLNRGSRTAMIVMGLEAKAEPASGRVHTRRGKHAIMVLVSDLRYVSVEE